MNPKKFLLIGGGALILLNLLGTINVLGPVSASSIFRAAWWFDDAENWTHLVFGIVALVAAFALSAARQKPLVMLLGIAGIIIGLYSLFIGPEFLGANLENPADSLLHLALGFWALWSSMGASLWRIMMPEKTAI